MTSRRCHRKEWQVEWLVHRAGKSYEANGRNGTSRKRRLASRFDIPIGLASVRRQFRVLRHLIGTQHWRAASFRDFQAGSRNGKPDEGFGFHDRKEGGGYEPAAILPPPSIRWGYPRFAEQVSKFPVQFRCTRVRIPVPVTHRFGEMCLHQRESPNICQA